MHYKQTSKHGNTHQMLSVIWVFSPLKRRGRILMSLTLLLGEGKERTIFNIHKNTLMQISMFDRAGTIFHHGFIFQNMLFSSQQPPLQKKQILTQGPETDWLHEWLSWLMRKWESGSFYSTLLLIRTAAFSYFFFFCFTNCWIYKMFISCIF